MLLILNILIVFDLLSCQHGEQADFQTNNFTN